jgi:hypothetical protein
MIVPTISVLLLILDIFVMWGLPISLWCSSSSSIQISMLRHHVVLHVVRNVLEPAAFISHWGRGRLYKECDKWKQGA